MSDNYHQAVKGGTGANHIMLGTGDAIWFSDGNGNSAVPPNNPVNPNLPGTPPNGISALSEIENPNPQPSTNNFYTQDGYGGGSGSPTAVAPKANYGGGSYSNCSDATQPGVPAVLNYLNSLERKVNPNCESGHYYLLNNYNPGYFGDGTNAYTDTNPSNYVFTIPPSSVCSIGDALLEKNISFAYYGDQFNRYGKRQRTRVFAELQSHYLFKDRFGRPGKGNDKGKVEGLVGYARRNYLVPIPMFESFEALNAHLLECCRRRMTDCLRGHDGTIGERLARDLAAFQTLPPAPYDACEKVATSVSSLSLVRYQLNDYSVPTSYGYCDVLVRGYIHEVVISCGAEMIARHPRSYEREDFVFEPLHYLALIEQKINALDQAAPLAGWQLPEEFMTLRRLLEARMGKQGKREFVQVLRLMEVFRADEVAAAVRNAIARGAIGFDAVKHLVLCHIERRPPRLDMTVYPYLPRAHVAMTSAKTYLGLLTGAAS